MIKTILVIENQSGTLDTAINEIIEETAKALDKTDGKMFRLIDIKYATCYQKGWEFNDNYEKYETADIDRSALIIYEEDL